ncbi:hypothetical protein R69608_06223 [Paraburkholderia nemoris]|uniref:Transposase n=1 Tax=Paraburkholderia nemoris TaxID=2793076 RepID=A0ABM8T650_9BURK|nr:hypothetical protein R69619_06337 [Paraburkholderia nemoris]CAE6843644.1 hypothetical protein R75777_07199 [Paraburkholderia nemoris]CAE6858556.1 hypothetical protein R69776_07878 [Paraburkholderia nemoris]CAE6895074.1 hypothetical protein R69749_07831 [Paraburkholderia domus]CAE6957474.1 hypothetical protein R69608_06223 [Paraburkholderia nemoris]
MADRLAPSPIHWHRLRCGTRFEREFTYRAPSLWFAIFNWFMLRARIQLESDTAVLRLKSLLEVAPQR